MICGLYRAVAGRPPLLCHREIMIGCALPGDAGRRCPSSKNLPKTGRDGTKKTPGGRRGLRDAMFEAPIERVYRDAILGNTGRQEMAGMQPREAKDAGWGMRRFTQNISRGR